MAPSATILPSEGEAEDVVGRFLLGFIVAIVLVIVVVIQCVGALT